MSGFFGPSGGGGGGPYTIVADTLPAASDVNGWYPMDTRATPIPANTISEGKGAIFFDLSIQVNFSVLPATFELAMQIYNGAQPLPFVSANLGNITGSHAASGMFVLSAGVITMDSFGINIDYETGIFQAVGNGAPSSGPTGYAFTVDFTQPVFVLFNIQSQNITGTPFFGGGKLIAIP